MTHERNLVVADDEVLADEELDEALSELANNLDWADGAVLWSTDWTAETIMAQMTRGNIDLDPSFQRRAAWKDDKQSLFIESLILGLPIPQLILAESKEKKGSFIVIDGKQRLLSIRRFGSTNTDGDFTPLKLKGLSELSRLNGKTYVDLLSDPALADDLTAFQNSSVRTVVIRNWKSESYLYEVFLRINTGSVQLSPQELRQALHPGPFSKFISKASEEAAELQKALNLKAPDFRMRDAEILLRFLAYRNFIRQYNGNLKLFLDQATQNLSKDWDVREGEIRGQVQEMEKAIIFARSAFGERGYLRKWDGQRFEPRKNRAVFDIMLHYFSIPEVRSALENKKDRLVARFKDLCQNNKEFRASIEITTKSFVNNATRFNIWADVVSEFSGMNLDHIKFAR